MMSGEQVCMPRYLLNLVLNLNCASFSFFVRFIPKKMIFFFIKDFSALEYHLVNVSDPAVLLEFYAPIQDSLSVINNALGTLAQEGDGMIRERQKV